MKGIIIKSMVGIVIAVAALLVANSFMKPADAAGCSPDSVINCGVTSVKEMRQKYNSDYTKGTKNIYTGMGITSDMVNNAHVVNGTIHKNGEVKVGSTVIATGATTAGRSPLDKRSTKVVTNGTTWYTGSPEYRFVTKQVWDVFIFLDNNGKYIGAVMLDCGNPVKAKPVVPVATCDSLTTKTISRDNRSFTANATAKKGAKIVSYTYDFGDGSKTTTAKKTVQHQYKKAGNYTAKLTVNFTVNGKKNIKKTAKACEVAVKVTQPVYTCDNLTTKKLSRDTHSFTANATAKDGAKIKSYTYDFGDGTKTTTDKKTVQHQYKTPGKYTAKLTVNFTVDGKSASKTAKACETPVQIAKPEVKKIQVCDLNSKKIVTIKEDEFDSSKHSKSLEDCKEAKEIVVCELDTKEIITIKEDEFDSDKHSKNLEDCDNPIQVCDLESKTIITIDEKDFDSETQSKNLDDCKEVPEVPETPETPETPEETPAELPQTGPVGAISQVIGAVTLVGATTYYITSRRA